MFWKHRRLQKAQKSPERLDLLEVFQSETKMRGDAPESGGYIVFLLLAASASYNALCLGRKAEEAVVIIYFLLFKVAPLVMF